MISFVEQQRQLPFLSPPVVTFVDEAEFIARVEAMVDDSAAALDLDEAAFKALGWMNPDDSLAAKYRVAFGSGVMGFYDPLTGELAVRGQELTAYRTEVVVHELVHALDDQHFVLDEGDNADAGLIDSARLGFLVGVEGDAAAAQNAWGQYRGPVHQAASLVEQLSMPISAELLTVPIALLSLAQAPYLQGPRFVAALGGNGGIDTMLTNLPVSEEQAWFPDRYLAGDTPVDLPDPVADGPEVLRGGFGPFLLTLMIQNGISLDAVAHPATAGWAGGEYVTWRQGDASCIRISLRQDSAEQADGLRGQLATWAAGAANAQVVAADADTAITSCDRVLVG
ncbi:MAG: hypothetical protein GX868_07115 [Actinobacteria bacterium]|nr:hypothetical protein [Actinomycetota bacterium]